MLPPPVYFAFEITKSVWKLTCSVFTMHANGGRGWWQFHGKKTGRRMSRIWKSMVTCWRRPAARRTVEMNPSSIIIVLLWEMKVKLSTSNRFEANFTWEKRRKTECPAFYSSSLPLSFILFYLKSKWRCLSKTGKKQQFNCRVHTYKAKDFLIDKYGGKFPCFSEIRVIESSSDQKIAIWFALLQ